MYQMALRFTKNWFSYLSFVLYSKWSALGACCLSYCYVFIYRAILDTLSVYLSSLLNLQHENHSLHSLDILQFFCSQKTN